MGTCGAAEKNKKKGDTTKTNTTKNPQPNENTGIKLKGAPRKIEEPSIPQTFKFNIIDVKNNNELIEKEINNDGTLIQLFDSIGISLLGDFDIVLGNGNNLNDEMDTKISDLLNTQYRGKEKPPVFEIIFTNKGLSIPKDVKKAYIESTPIIGNPIFDNSDLFGIIIYERDTNFLVPHRFPAKLNESLLKYGSFSAYCNAKGKLFISGGENDVSASQENVNEKYNSFFSIDLQNLNDDSSIEVNHLPNLIEPKTWHSMIFIPNNYIFIVGGSDSKTVELFNLESQELKVDSELNEERSESTLCLVNNTYLYCFCGFLFQSQYIKTIERCNLLNETRQWDYVEYNIDPNNFNVSFFGVSYFKDNELLLIGGNDNAEQQNKSYIFKPPTKENSCAEITEFTEQNQVVGVFREKLFIPIENEQAINIPLITGDDFQYFSININTGNIEIKK